MRKIRTKIQILAAVMVVFTVSTTVAPVLFWAVRDSDSRIEKSLAARGDVLDKLMGSRAGQIQQTVRLASMDSGFRAAVAGTESGEESPIDVDRLLRVLGEKLSAKDAARIVADITGGKKNALYERLLEIRRSQEVSAAADTVVM